ncbi:MAG: hypothetical protein AAGH57_09855 [Pseudomonadota bacterium]
MTLRAACILIATLSAAFAPANAVAQSSADDSARAKGLALAKSYYGFQQVVEDLDATRKNWKPKKVWKRGKKAAVSPTEESMKQTMVCLAGAEAGLFSITQTGDFASGKHWAETANFFKFMIYAQAGKLDFDFNQAKNLVYPGSAEIRVGLNRKGFSDAEIAKNYEYCRIAEQNVTSVWGMNAFFKGSD